MAYSELNKEFWIDDEKQEGTVVHIQREIIGVDRHKHSVLPRY